MVLATRAVYAVTASRSDDEAVPPRGGQRRERAVLRGAHGGIEAEPEGGRGGDGGVRDAPRRRVDESRVL